MKYDLITKEKNDSMLTPSAQNLFIQVVESICHTE